MKSVDTLSRSNRHQFLDYMHADLGLAVRNYNSNLCGPLRVGENRLRFHLTGDAQAIEHFGEMDAARAAARWIDIGNRLRGEQRVFQGVWRRDIGLGCALPNGHENAGAG